MSGENPIPNPKTPHPSDQELVARAALGDTADFEALYHRHRDWVIALAWRLTRNHADTLDVAQETFAYLWKRIPTLTLEARLTTFLYPAVRNLAADAAKRRKRHAPSLTTDASDHAQASPEAPAPSSPPHPPPPHRRTRIPLR